MNELRLDPLSGRWVAVTPGRHDRGMYLMSERSPAGVQRDGCPFCPGSTEIGPIAADVGGLDIRVLPNRYPAFEGDEPFVVNHLGPVFASAPASGVHEILLFSTDHDLGWADLSDLQSGLVMAEVAARIAAHQARPGLRYSQVIMNVGREAGASIEHPHCQLLGIPFVPRDLVDEQGAFSRFAGGCLLCTATASEERLGYRIVSASDDTVTLAPFWSSTPYEMLIVPRTHGAHLHDAAATDLSGAGVAVRDALGALSELLGPVAFNVVFHAAPYRATSPYHWHVHVLPKLTSRAGFELGTGVHVNVVAPETAAPDLRGALMAFEGRRLQSAAGDIAR